MRILHIHDVAGVATVLAHYQNKNGHKARILTVRSWDTLRFSEIYPNQIKLFNNFKTLLLYALCISLFYDVIHVHYFSSLLKWFKRFYSKKVLVMHYVGSDIRYLKDQKRDEWINADIVVVCMPELKEMYPSFFYIPLPVDCDFFNREQPYKKGTGVMIVSDSNYTLSQQLALEEAKKRDIVLTILNRKTDGVPFPDLPRFLEKFEYYFDYRQEPQQHKLLDCLSLTALQSLALGCKVVFDSQLITVLPQEHQPDYTLCYWLEIYELIYMEKNK